jgi:hypothetical protein
VLLSTQGSSIQSAVPSFALALVVLGCRLWEACKQQVVGAAALVAVRSCSHHTAVAAADMGLQVGVHTAAGTALAVDRAPAEEVRPNQAAAAAEGKGARLAGIPQVVGTRTCC